MAQVATVYSIAPFPLGVRSLTSTAAGGTFATGAAAGSAVLLAKVVPVVLASTEAASLAIAASPRLVAVGQAIVNALSAEGAPTIISGVAAAGGAALRGPAGELIDEFGDDAARTLKGAGDELVEVAGGLPETANFAQKTFGRMFSRGGAFAGRSVEDVANALRSGTMKPSDVPIDYIVREGNTLILNTRSAQALQAAGIPRSGWTAVNRTGQDMFESMLTGQLQRNGLTSAGTPTVRQSGL